MIQLMTIRNRVVLVSVAVAVAATATATAVLPLVLSAHFILSETSIKISNATNNPAAHGSMKLQQQQHLYLYPQQSKRRLLSSSSFLSSKQDAEKNDAGGAQVLNDNDTPKTKNQHDESDHDHDHDDDDETAANEKMLANGLDCLELLHRVHRANDKTTTMAAANAAAQWDPNDGNLMARYTKLHPQFWISLHVFAYDKVRYGTLHWGKYYEKELSKAFTRVLTMQQEDDDGHDDNEPPQQHFTSKNDTATSTQQQQQQQQQRPLVIDVGGNIGWFSLLSAALGAEVHVFEPNIVNVIRLCESQCLNGWLPSNNGYECPGPMHHHHHHHMKGNNNNNNDDDNSNDSKRHGKIVIRTVGLGDEAGSFWFATSDQKNSNPGAGQIHRQKPQPRSNQNQEQAATKVKVMTLDQLVTERQILGDSDNNRTIAILKVDVEGLEQEVFFGGQKLLRSKQIQNIFMEANVRTAGETTKFAALCRLFDSAGYYVYHVGGSMGPTHPAVKVLPHPPNHTDFMDGLLWACHGFDKQNRHQCNLWWKAKQ